MYSMLFKNSLSVESRFLRRVESFKILKCFSFSFWYFLLKSTELISPILNPFRPVLSIYVGPIPFKVEPIFCFPFDNSDA